MATCPHCATENRADAAYCNTCGYALRGASPMPPSPVVSSPTATAPPLPGVSSSLNATGRLTPQSKLHRRYLILKNVGQGGMAAVYQAHDLRSGVSVAVKEMSQDGLSPEDLREALHSLRSEATMLTRLRHPNLPRVYETFSEGGRHYLVMDYIPGQTVEQFQRQRGGGALPEAEVLRWAGQLCNVLGYLHRQRPPIIFRDLKPANIMVTDRGQIKLIDFGIARVFAPGRTRDTQVLGTPGFAPPEQYGKAQTDARADIYALGCTLYQLLTGYDPGTTPFNLPPLSSRTPAVSSRVQRAIERATKLDREQRYSTVEAFQRDLLAPTPSSSAQTAMAQSQARVTAQRPAMTPAQSSTGTYQAARATPGTMAASVTVQPYTVDFGTLAAGQRGTVSITLSGQGGQPVRGRIASLVPWLQLDRERFDGPSTVVRVIAETSVLGGVTGMQTSSLQVNCDAHALFVPVRATIVPAPAPAGGIAARRATMGLGAKPSPPRAASTAAPKPAARPAPPKYAQSPASRTRSARFATGAVLGLVLAIWATVLPRQLLAHYLPRLTLTAPLALGLLALSAVAAGVGALVGTGALAGTGGPSWKGRLATSLVGALLGLAAVLLIGGPWYWTGLPGLLTRGVAIPQGVLLGAQLAASLGGALGADRVGSRMLLATWAFCIRYANVFVPLGAGLAGAWAGFVLTQGLLFGCLTPIGLVGGAWAGITLARILGFSFRPPAYRSRYPPRRMGRLYP